MPFRLLDFASAIWYNEKEGKFKKDAPKHLLMLDANSEELKELCKGDAIMEKFKENVDKLNDDETVIDFLTKEEEDEVIKNSYYDDGLEAGLKQGKELGQMEEKIDLAKKMKDNNIDLGLISKITGLYIKELETLHVN